MFRAAFAVAILIGSIGSGTGIAHAGEVNYPTKCYSSPKYGCGFPTIWETTGTAAKQIQKLSFRGSDGCGGVSGWRVLNGDWQEYDWVSFSWVTYKHHEMVAPLVGLPNCDDPGWLNYTYYGRIVGVNGSWDRSYLRLEWVCYTPTCAGWAWDAAWQVPPS